MGLFGCEVGRVDVALFGGHGDGRFIELANVDVSRKRRRINRVALLRVAEPFRHNHIALALGHHKVKHQILAIVRASNHLPRRNARASRFGLLAFFENNGFVSRWPVRLSFFDRGSGEQSRAACK